MLSRLLLWSGGSSSASDLLLFSIILYLVHKITRWRQKSCYTMHYYFLIAPALEQQIGTMEGEVNFLLSLDCSQEQIPSFMEGVASFLLSLDCFFWTRFSKGLWQSLTRCSLYYLLIASMAETYRGSRDDVAKISLLSLDCFFQTFFAERYTPLFLSIIS